MIPQATQHPARATRNPPIPQDKLQGYEFQYRGGTYAVLQVGRSRWTYSGAATKVFAVNTTTRQGGRYFDLAADGTPFRFSPD